ncbi:MAG: UPF0164 family protein [Spirochaetes bacterium]|nr:UPF0164 family protein [Spirochaetota bacterium]
MKKVPAFVKESLILAILGWGLVLIPGLMASEFQDLYGDTSKFFEFIQDPNTGLTIFPILTIPVGGEYEGMGTAYTAIARDSSFFDANPAASSFLEYTELGFLHNNWIADTNIEGLVYTKRTDTSGYAIAAKFLYVPFTGYNIWGERTSAGYYSETIGIFNYSRNFFRSYEFNGLAVGTNLKVALRHIPESIASGQSAVGVMTDIGVLTRFNFLKFYPSRSKNASLGVVVKNVGPYVLGEPLPTSVTVGFGYWPLRPWAIAFDLNIPFSFDPSKYPAERMSYAWGTSVAITNFFSLQSGFLLKGGNPRFSLGSMVGLDTISFVANYTLDMTTQFTNLDRFSIQLKINLGDEGRKAKAQKVEDLYLSAVEAFARGEFQKSLELCDQALAIDPTFTPARETIQSIERSLKLQKEIEARQRIE